MGSKKKKAIIVVLVIVAILILGLSLIGFDNLKAVYYGLRYDSEEIGEMKQTSSERLQQKVEEVGYITAREPSPEELKAVESGEITEEQLAEIIASEMTLDEFREKKSEKKDETPPKEPESEKVALKPQDSKSVKKTTQVPKENKAAEPKTEKKPQPAVDTSQAECDEKVSQIVAKMYILRSNFTSALAGLADQAIADRAAGATKAAIISKYIGQGSSLEAQCDASVDALMTELKGILVQYGRSTDLVNTIYTTYENEKQYTKAHYMSLYAK